ncbi:1-phosphatidylinositol 4,5-bisphosphate phosphodiesterase eta-2-like isoform X2 [Paramacrobiotus metropolitanus]|nr:1-phosphatidylinositol 4,5-bisphosphate phosphodiesterase eta-2-like isoform X2 [Paramacrobiotus metropolitanus]
MTSTADPEELKHERWLEAVINGHRLIKLKAAGGKVHREFSLRPDMRTIVYDTAGPACFTPHRLVEVAHVREVRSGYSSDTFNFNEKKPAFVKKYPGDRCFCIVLRNKRILNLIAENKDVRDMWVAVLQKLIDENARANRDAKLSGWLRSKFEIADKNADGCLSSDEAVRLLNSMNIQFSREKALGVFQAAKPAHVVNGAPVLDMEGFERFYNLIAKRPEIVDIFEQFKADKEADYWTAKDLLKFLQDSQHEYMIDEEGCEMMIRSFDVPSEERDLGHLSLSGLANILLSPRCAAFDPNCNLVRDNMTHPITDYFIASSHNSYLVGGQLTGKSSIEGYIYCLLKGCRCIELDCWDGKDGEPIVTHGGTLTTDIHFEDVVEAVRDHGFKRSEYPIILSFENHCSVAQQDRMAYHLRNILGDRLFTGPIRCKDRACPSPEELKGKVLIKAKKLPTEILHDADVDLDEEENSEHHDHDHHNHHHHHDKGEPEKPVTKPKETLKVSKALSDCVYLKAVKFKGTFSAHADGKFFEISSVSESKILKLIKKNHLEIIQHTMRQLVRIYPKGTRITSTNFDAVPLLDSGCQIVAMNYQNHNRPTQAYRALFRDNGGCGYILQPEYMRTPGLDYNAFKNMRPALMLSVRVISGQQLPKPVGTALSDIIDPYVVVQIVGAEFDQQKKSTKFIKNNGFNPVWDTTVDLFIRSPELAVLRFKVRDQANVGKNKLIGQHTIAVGCLQEGYRHVELYTKNDLPLEMASIFVEVRKLVIVPEEIREALDAE